MPWILDFDGHQGFLSVADVATGFPWAIYEEVGIELLRRFGHHWDRIPEDQGIGLVDVFEFVQIGNTDNAVLRPERAFLMHPRYLRPIRVKNL